LPPPALFVRPTAASSGPGPIAGVDIGYSAPWEGRGWRAHRWRNRPCCFLHFNVFRRVQGRRGIPKRARPARLGSKHGLLAPAREGAYYGSELYSANHVRFLWRERGVNWVATLHTFGEKPTERLLDRLIASLRPVTTLSARRPRGTPVGVTPNAIVAGEKSLWVASFGRLLGSVASPAYGTVYRIRPSTAAITGHVNPAAGGGAHSLALVGGALWVATYNQIARIEPASVRRVAIVGAGGFPRGIATAAGRLWVADATPFGKNGKLVSVDPRGNRRVGPAFPLGRAPTALTSGTRALWVVDELEGVLARVDPMRRRVFARVKVGRMPTAVTAGAGSVWVANTGDGTVSRIDPRTNRVAATFWVGLAPRALAVGAGAIWVATTGDGCVRRIDPASNRVTIVRRGLVDPLALLVVHQTLWVTTNDGELLRIRLS
jgi:YVTN family beta-propeller protein